MDIRRSTLCHRKQADLRSSCSVRSLANANLLPVYLQNNLFILSLMLT